MPSSQIEHHFEMWDNASQRISMIWTRDLPSTAVAGRLRTMSFIREVGDAAGAHHLLLRNVLETKRVGEAVEAALLFVWGMLRLRPIPLQVLLFSGSLQRRKLMRALTSSPPSILYLDSIRTASLLPALRKALPDCRIVMDLDDLMSRRMKVMRKSQTLFSLGYLSKFLPSWLVGKLQSGIGIRLLLHYEEVALRLAEDRAADICDAVVLVSSVEADVLRARLGSLLADKVVAVPPPAAPAKADARVDLPVRFAFVGSDELTQNRLSIGFLLDSWRKLRPSAALHIYGRMCAPYESIDGVTFHGLVDDLRAALEGSVLLVPSFIGGGVKTKVLDGFGFGCAVAGTSEAFEGLEIGDYPLIFGKPEEMEELIFSPDNFFPELRRAAELGYSLANGPLSLSVFQKKWRSVLVLCAKSVT